MNRMSLFALRHACCRWLGMILSRIHLHRVDFVLIDGVALVRKRRAYYACLMIPPGNLFLKVTRSSFVVLPLIQWLDWEWAVGNAIGRPPVRAQFQFQRTEHWSRQISGRTLRQILTDTGISNDEKLDAIRWSLTALRVLHERVVDWGNETYQSISHGDATGNNVIVDIDKRVACWIDFEARHQSSLPELDRRADDLRAVIYSAAVYLPISSFSALADVLATSPFETELFQHFHQRLAVEWGDLTVAQLAQSPLQWPAAKALRAALLESLNPAPRKAHSRSDTSSSL